MERPLVFALLMFSFTPFAKGTVISVDHQNKLEWTVLSGSMLAWTDARVACSNFGSGWKLPSKSEFERSASTLASSSEIASKRDFAFWSETAVEEDQFKNGRVYAFTNGKIELRDRESDGEAIIYPVACVRKILSASTGSDIPKKFLGHWEPSRKWCEVSKKSETKEGIDIAGSQIAWYETSCKILSVESSSEDSLTAKLNCESEGEEYAKTLQMEISTSGKLTLKADKMTLSGIRCK